ncbi:PAS domain S-box protein [Sphaerospermopsis aphanizomenoides BCCUSP55]|uniref:PAS domain S-box protein n=1 Tax=Sphaerospermopsis aphanizomenoides TaxID=459663 RepID=UPI00190699C7|nr:PAS domain S-box protein [Sphaerospermopsis aphanizomenoides]MBK1988896.1 PAS domain S-box protein [Sphaerospermopsis aphanizomenoides BCCUSP55]
MQVSPHYLVLQSLDSIIDRSPLTVAPETLVLDAITLMVERCQGVLVKSDCQLVGCLTQQDIMRLVAARTELKNTTIAEVMQTSMMKLNLPAIKSLTTVMPWLSQAQLVAIVDEQDQTVGVITPESICLALEVVEVLENQLLQSRQMLQLIMDTIPHSIFWKDINSVFLGCNRNFAKMVGFENPEDIIGKTDYDLVANQEQAEFYRAYDAAVMQTNQAQYQAITPKQQADGSQIWLETNKVPLHNTEGQVVGMLGTIEDITNRKQAQDALEKSEERFRFLAESIPQQVWIADADGNIEYINQRTLDDFGCTQDQVLSRQWIQWVHPDDLPNSINIWHQSLSTGTNYEVEFRLFQKASGIYRWHLGRALPLRDRQGKIVNWFGTNTDIHDRVTAETSLRASEERFRNLVEASSDWVWEVDENIVYTYVSPQVREILGYEPQQVLGKTPFELMPLEEAARVSKIFRSITASRQSFKYLENINVHQDGHLVVLETNGVPIFDVEGKFCGYRGIDRDITVRQQESAKLWETQQRLQAILDNLPAVMYLLDTENRYLLVNKQFEKISGINEEQIVGKSVYDIWPQEIAEKFAADNLAVITSGIYRENEEIAPHADGLHTYFSIKFPLKDTQGINYAICGISTDITDRKLTEQELRQSEEYFHLLVEGVKDYAIYMLDPNGRVMSWNSGAECITGYQAVEIVGRDFSCFFPPEDIANAIPKQQLEIAKLNSRCECESIFVRKDGSYFWANCILTPLSDDTGELRGYCKITRDITERKLTEKSLLRLQKAIESTSDGISIADISGQIIYVNPAFTEVFDYTGIELNSNGGLVATFRNVKVFETVFATVHRGESWHGEVSMQTRSGNYVQIYLRTDAIKDATEKIVYFVSIYTDITQSRLIEEGLRLRDRAIAASSNGIIIADITIPDGSITYVNPAFERMTGYTATEVIRQNFRLFLGADINQSALEQMRTAMQAGQDCTVMLRNSRKDGSLFWHEFNISPVYDTDGCLTHYIGILTDITQRKQAETALLVTQQRLQYLLAASPAIIYTSKHTKSSGIVFISDNVKGMIGYEAQEFIQDSSFWYSHIHPEDAPTVLAELSQVLEQKHYSLEYRFLHADGTYRWIYDQGKVVWDETGNPIELVGYCADISSRKQLEQELRTALEKEKELNELKSRFISMTSHEFRTPLSTILSSAELLEHYHQRWTPEKQLTHLRRIQIAVHRMTEMLDDILVIGKAEAGKLEYKPLYFDLVEYCRQLVEEVQLNLKSQRLISFSSQSESISCYMDNKLLGYILSNLLSNALKYSADGSLVRFTLACEDEQAVFEIQDQGIGIPEEDLPRLFESFHRANNVGNILGTGLGLAIVKKCVDIHQGQISLISKLGIGTQFTVKLPLKKYTI